MRRLIIWTALAVLCASCGGGLATPTAPSPPSSGGSDTGTTWQPLTDLGPLVGSHWQGTATALFGGPLTSAVTGGRIEDRAVLWGSVVTASGGSWAIQIFGIDSLDTDKRIVCGADYNTRWDRLDMTSDGTQIRVSVSGAMGCGGFTGGTWIRQ